MRAILADQNVEGHVAALVRILQREPWQEFWADLNLSVFTFTDLGLLSSVADSILWHACQQEGVVLITSNRNTRGPESLEATIRAHNQPESLPVFTRIRKSGDGCATCWIRTPRIRELENRCCEQVAFLLFSRPLSQNGIHSDIMLTALLAS